MSIRDSAGMLAVLLVVSLAACRIERTPGSGAADAGTIAREQIELLLIGYQNAIVNNDSRGAAGYFSAGARLQLPDSPDIEGRPAIDTALANAFGTQRVISAAFESDGIDIAGNVAHQYGSFHRELRTGTGATRPETGRFAIRWRRAAESTWQIERLMINYYPAGTAARASGARQPGGL